jgi:hypothetical protein
MTTETPHTNRSIRRVLLFALAVLVALVAAGLAATPSHGGRTGYNWPVAPFEREHPVRGVFGDPRTIFSAPPTAEGALTGGGDFQFHFGVDISARDGTIVYPVVSGTVTSRSKDNVFVSCGGGRVFEYWHVAPSVGVGSHVTAYRTELGRIVRGAKHVHLSELLDGAYVNPLQAGHLTPYTDREAPRIVSVSAQVSDGAPALVNLVRGRIEFVVEAYDAPNLPVPGIWRDMPVSPALVTWKVRDMRGKVVLGSRVAVDFRFHIPAKESFWRTYARGSFQNMSVFGKHYSYRQPGRYLYRLTATPFDSSRLKDGVYDLVVTAVDIRGNADTASLRFTVANHDAASHA